VCLTIWVWRDALVHCCGLWVVRMMCDVVCAMAYVWGACYICLGQEWWKGQRVAGWGPPQLQNEQA